MTNNYNVVIGTAGPSNFPNFLYIVVDKQTRDVVVVDPAWDVTGLLDRIKKEGWNLRAVLLTHSHSDHINGVVELVNAIPTPVYLSADETSYYNVRLPGLVVCSEGELLTAGSLKIRVMVTPGHTIGSSCFLIGKCLFVGDTLFPEGIGFTHYMGGSVLELYDSVQRLSKEVADDTRIYSGHRYRRGPGIEFRQLRRINIYLRLSSRQDFVCFSDRRTQATSHDAIIGDISKFEDSMLDLNWEN